MKKNSYISIFIFLFLITINLSCRNSSLDPYKDIPNPKDVSAPIVLVDKLNTPVINATDLANSAYSIELSSRGSVKSFEVQVFVKRNETLISDTAKLKVVTTFPSTFTMKASEILAVIPRLKKRDAKGNSLYVPADATTFTTLATLSDFVAGDEIGLVGIIEGTDGIKYEIKDIQSDLLANSGQRVASRLVTFISCPLSDAIAGTYKIVTDDFGGALPDDQINISVVKGPGANQVTIKDAFGHFGVEGDPNNKYDVILDVNPATGQTTVAAQRAMNYNLFGATQYGYLTIEAGANKGFTFACTGTINLTVTYRVNAGSFGEGIYRIQKQ